MGDSHEAIPSPYPRQQDESLRKIKERLHEDTHTEKQLKPHQLRSSSPRRKCMPKISANAQIHASNSEDAVAVTSMSPTIGSSHDNDSSISSIDDEPHGHGPNRFRMKSRRTFRHRTVSQPAVDKLKEEEEAVVETAQQLAKLPLKSRSLSNKITCHADSGENLYPLIGSHFSLPKQGPSFSSIQQPNHISGSPLKQPILNSFSQKHGLSEQLNMVDDCRCESSGVVYHRMERNFYPVLPFICSSPMAYNGHSHCSSCTPLISCCRSSLCSCCAHGGHSHSFAEEVGSSSMKEKQLHARHHCRPICNGAPFVICDECFELLRLPLDFCISRRGSVKLRCGACSKVLVLQFPAKDFTLRNLSDANARSLEQNYSLRSIQERKIEQELGPPLHQLMGYSSPTELLYPVGDADEEY